jgi:tetratricopeptide (TPR) repeat protein
MAGLPAVLSRGYLASYLSELGESAEAMARAEEGLEIAESVNDTYSIAFACVLIGWVGWIGGLRGSLTQVITTAERGFQLCRERDFRILFPSAACSLGSAYALAGRFGDAIALLEQAVDAAASVKRKDRYAAFLVRLSDAYLDAGYLDRLLEPAGRALKVAREQGERGQEAYALRLLAESAARAASPDPTSAEGLFGQAMVLAEELGMRPLMGHCRFGLGRLYRRMQNRPHARTQLEAAAMLYREIGMHHCLEQAQAELD